MTSVTPTSCLVGSPKYSWLPPTTTFWKYKWIPVLLTQFYWIPYKTPVSCYSCTHVEAPGITSAAMASSQNVILVQDWSSARELVDSEETGPQGCLPWEFTCDEDTIYDIAWIRTTSSMIPMDFRLMFVKVLPNMTSSRFAAYIHKYLPYYSYLLYLPLEGLTLFDLTNNYIHAYCWPSLFDLSYELHPKRFWSEGRSAISMYIIVSKVTSWRVEIQETYVKRSKDGLALRGPGVPRERNTGTSDAW